MPASRSEVAMIRAPRSCPSRPTFATRTRIGRVNGLLIKKKAALAKQKYKEIMSRLKIERNSERKYRADDCTGYAGRQNLTCICISQVYTVNKCFQQENGNHCRAIA